MGNKLLSESECWKLYMDIANKFHPISDRNCPSIQREDILKDNAEGYEPVDVVNLSELDAGVQIYFRGYHSIADHILKIVGNGQVKAWKDTYANALIGPIDRIISMENKPEKVDGLSKIRIEEGILRAGNRFVMPYFKYNNDIGPVKIKEVLQPQTIYFAICLGIHMAK